jgi:ribosome-associated protein
MDIKKQQRAVVDALEDIKAQNIQVYNTEEITSLFDRVVIATATSNRQTRALANSVQDKARELGISIIATEGQETGEWVLVDLGDIVVHIMQPTIREYYNLEEIWGGKSVRVKLDEPTAAKRAGKTADIAAKKSATKSVTKPATKSAKKATTKSASKVISKVASKAATNKVTKTATKPASKSAAKATTKTATKSATKAAKAPVKKAATK